MKADLKGAWHRFLTLQSIQALTPEEGSRRFLVLPWRQTVAAAQRGGVTCFTMVTMLGEERLFPRRCALPTSQMSSHDIQSRCCWLLISSDSGCSVLIILLMWVVFFFKRVFVFLEVFGLKSAFLICYVICSIIDECNLYGEEKCCVWQRRNIGL